MVYTCIQPVYVKDFHCDGRLCNSKCCRGWLIEVDAATYAKYRDIPNENLRRQVMGNLKKHTSSGKYRFQMEGINCPMLQQDWLCILQKNYGEEYLSDTCHQFPRRVHQILPDMVERVLSFACPVAAKLALSQREPMCMEAIKLDGEREKSFFSLPTQVGDRTAYLLSVQMAAITLLQNRQFSLNKRLKMLGAYLAGEKENTAVEANNIQIDILAQFADKICWNNEVWIRFLLELLDDLYGTAIVLAADDDINYVPMIIKAFHLEGTGKKSLKKLTAIYERGQKLFQKQVLERYDYMLEHYLVQEFFGNLYPYKWEMGIEENYAVFLIVYRFMELIILSMLLTDTKVGEAEIIALVGRMAQRTNHAKLYGKIILQKINNDGGDLFFLHIH